MHYFRSMCHVRFSCGADVVSAAASGERDIPEGRLRVPRLPRRRPRVPGSPQGHPHTRAVRGTLFCAVRSPPYTVTGIPGSSHGTMLVFHVATWCFAVHADAELPVDATNQDATRA